MHVLTFSRIESIFTTQPEAGFKPEMISIHGQLSAGNTHGHRFNSLHDTHEYLIEYFIARASECSTATKDKIAHSQHSLH